MDKMEALLTLEEAGELPADKQSALDTLRAAGQAPPSRRTDTAPADAGSEETWGQTLGAGALRIGGPIVGGVLGGPLGAAAGGFIGDIGARAVEGQDQNFGQSAVQGVVGGVTEGAGRLIGAALPEATTIGQRIVRGAVEGAAQGTAADLTQTGLETGDLPTAESLAANAGGGAVLGGALSAVHGMLKRPETPNQVKEHTAGHEIHGETTVEPGIVEEPPTDTPPVDRLSDEHKTMLKELAANTGAQPKSRERARQILADDAAHDLPAAKPAPEERVQRMIDRVDELHPDVPKEERGQLKDMYREYADDMNAQTRGVQPIARANGMAQAVVISADEVQVPGTAASNVTIKAQSNLMNVLIKKVIEYTEARKLDPQDGIISEALQKVTYQRNLAMKIFQGYSSEAGRSLNMLQHVADDLLTPEAKIARNAVKLAKDMRLNIPVDEIMAAVDRAGHDPRRVMIELGNIARHDWKTWGRSLYLNNLLTNPKTLERNGFGNIIRQGTGLATKPIAAGLDLARSAVTGKERQVFAGETWAGAGGAAKSIPAGFRAWLQVMQTGVSDYAAQNMLNPSVKGETSLGMSLFRGPLKHVSRFLEGTDQAFKIMGAAMERDSLAYAKAMQETGNLAGSARRRAVSALAAEYAHHPTNDMLKAIELAAKRSVFHESEAGPIQLTAQSISRWPVVGPMIAPFVTTPANIMRQGFQMTPAGLVMRGGVKGFLQATDSQAARDTATRMAETAFGMLTLAPLVHLAAADQLTGSAPSDPGARDAFLAKHPENSLRIGNRWYRYSDLGPLNVPLTIVANFVAAYKAAGNNPTDHDAVGLYNQVASGITHTGKSLFQQSYLSGIGDIVDAINDPDGNGLQKYLQRRVTSVVPGQGVLRAASDYADPTRRRPTDVGQAVEAIIPGLSEKVLPRLDGFGKPVMKDESGVGALTLPDSATRQKDPVRDELARYGIEPQPPKSLKSFKYGTSTIEVDEHQDFMLRQAKGLLKRAAFEQIINMPSYGKWTDAQRESALKKAAEQGQSELTKRAKWYVQSGKDFTTKDLLPAYAWKELK